MFYIYLKFQPIFYVIFGNQIFGKKDFRFPQSCGKPQDSQLYASIRTDIDVKSSVRTPYSKWSEDFSPVSKCAVRVPSEISVFICSPFGFLSSELTALFAIQNETLAKQALQVAYIYIYIFHYLNHLMIRYFHLIAIHLSRKDHSKKLS